MSLPIRFAGMVEGELGCLGGCVRRRIGQFSSGLSYPLCNCARRSRAPGYPRRPSGRVSHVRTASNCYDHSGFRRSSASDVDGADYESMWSLELDSAWARLDATCGAHGLAKSERLITAARVMLYPKRPRVARVGCVAEARSNNAYTIRSHDDLHSHVPLSAFATSIFPKLQADISEYVNLLYFLNPVPAFLTKLDRSLGTLYLVPTTVPFCFWLGPTYNGPHMQPP
jgi:hypothetical protein